MPENRPVESAIQDQVRLFSELGARLQFIEILLFALSESIPEEGRRTVYRMWEDLVRQQGDQFASQFHAECENNPLLKAQLAYLQALAPGTTVDGETMTIAHRQAIQNVSSVAKAILHME